MPDMNRMRKEIFSVSITDEKTRETIKDAYRDYNVIIEPHGAVGWAGMLEYLKENDENAPIICLETADPAKFPEELEELGVHPKIPESMKKLDDLKEIDDATISSDYEEFRKHLISKYHEK